MRPNYKRLFLWSSLGSVALGAAVTLARRSRRIERPSLACRKIPRECHGVTLWTERFKVEEQGTRLFAHDRYFLQPTSFKVWSVLDLTPLDSPGRPVAEGEAIYHVTYVRLLEEGHASRDQEEEHLQDRFYGVVTMLDRTGQTCVSGCIARGGLLEIKKCYVGGSSNGVESGEVHRSLAPILNYRIEYTSA
jgi:hypothetical protein